VHIFTCFICKPFFSIASFSGGKPSWGSMSKEIKSVISQTKTLIEKIKADFSRRRRQAPSTTANYTLCAVSKQKKMK
jgi:hypothetical protein